MLKPNKWVFGFFICFCIFFEIYFNFFSTKTNFSSIPPLEQQKISCEIKLTNNPLEFIIYSTEATVGLDLLNFLCDSRDLAKQYGEISLVIGQTDYDTFKYINYGIANLALIKENAAQAFNATAAYNMQLIGNYPDYEAFFIATHEKPKLTKQYFLDKRIGLLDYPTSRSGHIAPKLTFQDLDLNESALDIHYYNSHSEMKDKLLAGEVDVIASYWSENDIQRFSKSYITQIEQTFSGVQWYLKDAEKNSDLLCLIQTAIEKTGKSHYSAYYHTPEWVAPCKKQRDTL